MRIIFASGIKVNAKSKLKNVHYIKRYVQNVLIDEIILDAFSNNVHNVVKIMSAMYIKLTIVYIVKSLKMFYV